MTSTVAGKATKTARKGAGAAGKAASGTAAAAGETAKGVSGAPGDLIKGALRALLVTLGRRAASSVTDKVASTTERLTSYAEGGRAGGGVKAGLAGARKLAEGKSPLRAAVTTGWTRLKDKVKGAFGGSGKGGGNTKLKATNIVESIDVGVPVELAYAQWTRFTDFPKFMKKVNNVEQKSDEKLEWKAQVLWSHRIWEATILDQVPNERIVWRSKGQKGHVDGAITFHELAPRLTRIVLVLEYHPQGLFERTGNLWRAQGRRVRLELKHFRRHVMTEAILNPDDVEGWAGEIRDGEVIEDDRDQPDTDSATDDGDIEEGDESEEDSEGDLDDSEQEEQEPEERPKRRRAAPSARRAATGTRARGSRTGGNR